MMIQQKEREWEDLDQQVNNKNKNKIYKEHIQYNVCVLLYNKVRGGIK